MMKQIPETHNPRDICIPPYILFMPMCDVNRYLYPPRSLCVLAVNFQWRVHKSHGQGLALRTLLLLAMRREPHRTALRHPGRSSVLHQVLRECVRQYVRGVQQDHWHRLQGT